MIWSIDCGRSPRRLTSAASPFDLTNASRARLSTSLSLGLAPDTTMMERVVLYTGGLDRGEHTADGSGEQRRDDHDDHDLAPAEADGSAHLLRRLGLRRGSPAPAPLLASGSSDLCLLPHRRDRAGRVHRPARPARAAGGPIGRVRSVPAPPLSERASSPEPRRGRSGSAALWVPDPRAPSVGSAIWVHSSRSAASACGRRSTRSCCDAPVTISAASDLGPGRPPLQPAERSAPLRRERSCACG